ncbi:hypothetical protein TIFTF001_020448 [Ficus carica]|uniref:Uncharacterized protein n=1 Tax=Ficus carica TaxID=3494 RepID=A0AA88AXY9_FICCA|nr:hypothetical protein TIFTF001_020448 [Ficus carica]
MYGLTKCLSLTGLGPNLAHWVLRTATKANQGHQYMPIGPPSCTYHVVRLSSQIRFDPSPCQHMACLGIMHNGLGGELKPTKLRPRGSKGLTQSISLHMPLANR